MKRVYINEAWNLGCHLCEYNCAVANPSTSDMATAFKDKTIYPRIHAGIYHSLIRQKTPLESINSELLVKIATTAAFSKENRRKKNGGVV